MQIVLRCVKCSEGRAPEFAKMPEVFGTHITNDGVYELTCPTGHKTVTVLNAVNFELLFDSGANAFVDGYYREAVASFTAALERFFEFYFRVFYRARDLNESAIEAMWRTMSIQSERQLGAFCLAHLVLTKSAYDTNKKNSEGTKWSEFRNDIVHKGYFPEPEQAREYGRFVYDTITRLLDELERTTHESVLAEYNARMQLAHQKASKLNAETTVAMARGTMLDFLGRGTRSPRPSFDKHLEDFREWWSHEKRA